MQGWLYADGDVGSAMEPTTAPLVAFTSSTYSGCATPAAQLAVLASPTRSRARLAGLNGNTGDDEGGGDVDGCAVIDAVAVRDTSVALGLIDVVADAVAVDVDETVRVADCVAALDGDADGDGDIERLRDAEADVDADAVTVGIDDDVAGGEPVGVTEAVAADDGVDVELPELD